MTKAIVSGKFIFATLLHFWIVFLWYDSKSHVFGMRFHQNKQTPNIEISGEKITWKLFESTSTNIINFCNIVTKINLNKILQF